MLASCITDDYLVNNDEDSHQDALLLKVLLLLLLLQVLIPQLEVLEVAQVDGEVCLKVPHLGTQDQLEGTNQELTVPVKDDLAQKVYKRPTQATRYLFGEIRKTSQISIFFFIRILLLA